MFEKIYLFVLFFLLGCYVKRLTFVKASHMALGLISVNDNVQFGVGLLTNKRQQ